MLYKLVLKLLIAVCVFLVVFLSGNVNCYSQAATKLKSFNMQKIKQGLLINIENSNSPADFTVEESDRPPQLLIEIIGAEVSFKEYENRPIEMPVHEKGITKVVVEERSNYKRIPQESVAIRVELSRLFHYDVDAQFNGKFLTVLIAPYGEDIQGTILDEKGKTLLNPSERLKEIKILKEKEAQKARQRLRDFTQETRVELIRKESKERVSEIREKAQERIESGKTLEESYKKMKAETEISSLPMAMAHIEDKRLYEDITVPTDTRPVLQRMTPSQPVNKLENCINIALNKYLPLQIAKEQGELAKLRVREARRSFYPAFLGEWNEVDGDTVTEPYRGRSYGVQAEQPLFTGGKLMATLRKEQLGEVIAEGNFNRIKHDLMVQISKAYYELVLAKNTLDAMTRLLEVSEKLMGEIEKEFAVFSATPAELLNAQTILNQVNYQIAYSKRSFALAKLNLEKEMFTENIDVDNLDYHLEKKKIDITLEKCLELAFTNRAELNILEKTIEAAKYGQDIIRSEELPNFSLMGSYGRSGEAFTQRDLNLATEWKVMGKVRWFLGGNTMESAYTKDKVTPFKVTKTDTNVDSQSMNLKFSFWDNLAHFTKQKEAQITRHQAEKDLAEMRNKIRQETEDAYYSYQRYSTQLGLAINEIGYRRKQLEIIKTKRAMNEASGAEVMEAELQLAQSNGTLYESLAGVNVSIASLNRAIGVINYFYQ